MKLAGVDNVQGFSIHANRDGNACGKTIVRLSRGGGDRCDICRRSGAIASMRGRKRELDKEVKSWQLLTNGLGTAAASR